MRWLNRGTLQKDRVVFGTLKRNGLHTCGLRAVPGEWGARRSARCAAVCAVQVRAVCPDWAAWTTANETCQITMPCMDRHVEGESMICVIPLLRDTIHFFMCSHHLYSWYR